MSKKIKDPKNFIARLERLNKWTKSNERPANPNVVRLNEDAEKLSNSEFSMKDPRSRIVMLNTNSEFEGVISDYMEKRRENEKAFAYYKGKMTWNRMICKKSLDEFYVNLEEFVGTENKLTKGSKNMKLVNLFDMMSAYDLGLNVEMPIKYEQGGTRFYKIDNGIELSKLMKNILQDKNFSLLSKVMYTSPPTLKKMMKQPEAATLTTLLRILDQFEIKMHVYDKRMEETVSMKA